MDHCTRRSVPLRGGGDGVSKGRVVDLVNEDPEEGGGFIARIGLELRVDHNDECGGDCREQTSLLPSQHTFIKT